MLLCEGAPPIACAPNAPIGVGVPASDRVDITACVRVAYPVRMRASNLGSAEGLSVSVDGQGRGASVSRLPSMSEPVPRTVLGLAAWCRPGVIRELIPSRTMDHLPASICGGRLDDPKYNYMGARGRFPDWNMRLTTACTIVEDSC